MSAASPAPLRGSGRDPARVRAALAAWIPQHLSHLGIREVGAISLPDAAGVANETLLVDTISAQGPGPGLVVRIHGGDHLYLDSDLAVHCGMYRLVDAAGTVPVPAIHAFEPDAAVLGAPFMVMQRVPGRGPPDRPNFNRSGWLHDLSAAAQEGIWREAVSVMARLHAIDPARCALLARPADGATGLGQALAYWERYARWCSPVTHPLLAEAGAWLRRHLPADAGTGLSWGDARLQNMLFDGGRCTALLDWDMVSLAGAEADLAWWALADHKYTASVGRPRLPGIGSPAATIRLWEEASGFKARNMDWQLVFAAFRQASISLRLATLRGGAAGGATGSEPSIGLQWIACLLGLPLGAPVTQPFAGLEA